ncbi:hypothetical protein HOU26_gp24 [Escherichia phage IMM-002]|uniref:Uncharacterized protein n=1 Tax=Escherichia phage IMM-002 TaxID=2041760 RepID=A0A384WIF6_9CAUD|nr:hypothetical protein HOU26_gp24 [Escherichia phage IMM-002]ATI16983.1 hypothetical protein [Escherichia phage IMM-002]
MVIVLSLSRGYTFRDSRRYPSSQTSSRTIHLES